MSQYYLLNCVTVDSMSTPSATVGPPGTQGLGKKYLAGALIDSNVVGTVGIAGIQAVGGVLLPATDPVLSAAAAIAQARAKNRGVDESELNGIMMAAASQSTYAAAVQMQSIVIPLATIQAQTSGTAFNVGSALPTNARLIDAEVSVVTPVSGGSISAVTATLQGGSDAAGSIIASHSVFTGANPLNSPVGSNPYPNRSGQQLKMTLTSTGGALSTATAGALQVDIFYTTVATTSP
jgi:hypothetical protein